VSHDVYTLPEGLSVPTDDGAADHLIGLELPDLVLESSEAEVNLRDLDVIYVYPRSGRPEQPMLPGWDETPGARGCTPQSCAFRDLHGELAKLGVRVAGLSVQSLDDQREFAERNTGLNKRRTLVAEDARIVKVFYPVFPPDANAGDVLRWLQNR
jgi:peroxiredoxin